MKIAILCNDGSPLGVTMRTLYGEDGRVGVGGAELALLTMCEEWQKAGHEPVLFNDPTDRYVSPFEQRGVNEFDSREEWDAVIVFRSPNHRVLSYHGLRIWWSCDQFTVGDFQAFASNVNKIVTISPFHADYFAREYGITNTTTIDLPVRIDDYCLDNEKLPGRCIFTSVPDRGLQILHAAWPLIRRDYPQATLAITSDYRLWNAAALNEHHRLKWYSHEGVEFLGAVPRCRLIEYQMKAQVHLYPSVYEELACIAVMESQVAGAYPITSTIGALRTTNMGLLIKGNPTSPKFVADFVDAALALLSDPKLPEMQKELQVKAVERFHPDNILSQWDEKVFNE